jgi:pyruvate formate lyase activating enzyme
MSFGGLQKTSLIDYPEKVSCVLFLNGCNFECPYCHNPQLAKGCGSETRFTNGEGIYGFLEQRKTFLDGVVISGGEPTLDKDLVPLCENIKQMGYSIKLDTNGSRPQMIEKLIDEDLVDYIAMDVKTDLFHYAPFIQNDLDPDLLLRSIEVIKSSAPDYEFRTTCVEPIVDEKIIENIAQIIKGAKLYILQPFRAGDVLHPEFFKDPDTAYDPDQMRVLQSIAAPWVEECIVR